MTDNTAPAFSSSPEQSDTRAAAARQRLDRLEGFLRQDPNNDTLLIDAFETALSCRDWERALAHLQHGQTQPAQSLAWQLREGDFWLAQLRYDEALKVLEALLDVPQPPAGFSDVLIHNLAYIEMKRGRHAACVERLAPTLEAPAAGVSEPDDHLSSAREVLQNLWLRALHHDGQFERAMHWAQKAEQAGGLRAQAAGIASLIAIDAADFPAAQRWSSFSLENAPPVDPSFEALITQASLALAAQDAPRAIRFADAALQRWPADGRAWSARGFAALLTGDLVAAVESFRHALAVMGEHIGTWHGLGWTQIVQGDLSGAQASFEVALALDRNFAESHGGLAVVCALQARKPEAQLHAETALRLDRSNLSGRYAQALLSGEMKDAADVQRFARRLLGGRAGIFGGSVADVISPDTSDAAKANEGER